MSQARATQILEQAFAPIVLLSTTTKPLVGVAKGQSLYEYDTGYTWIFNGFAWVPKAAFPGQTVNFKSVSLATATTVDVMTATTQNLFIDAVIVHVPDNLSAVETFTGISVATDDDPVRTILAQADGVKAKLAGNFFHVFRGPVVSAATKKIQVTVHDAGAGAGKVAGVTVLWRPVVAGGYYLNA